MYRVAKWYDFYTGKLAGDGEVITVTPGLDKIPVYVKDGQMIGSISAAQKGKPDTIGKVSFTFMTK